MISPISSTDSIRPNPRLIEPLAQFFLCLPNIGLIIIEFT